METHENIEMQETSPEVTQESPEQSPQESTQESPEQSQELSPEPIQQPSSPSEEEWREKIRRAEEEGYLKGLNERAAALMAEPAPYEPVTVTQKVTEEIPFLKTIRRSVWDD